MMRTRGALPSYLDPLHSRRGIGDGGLHVLAPALGKLSYLSHLDLVSRRTRRIVHLVTFRHATGWEIAGWKHFKVSSQGKTTASVKTS